MKINEAQILKTRKRKRRKQLDEVSFAVNNFIHAWGHGKLT